MPTASGSIKDAPRWGLPPAGGATGDGVTGAACAGAGSGADAANAACECRADLLGEVSGDEPVGG
ncbi:hypothetical protein, partial [Rhodoblastus acidophilus]|uniref:hypothetical protein n=1 Tax=Rhodoblastus acidophilus TaxID=1074 RepID=UPI001FE15589